MKSTILWRASCCWHVWMYLIGCYVLKLDGMVRDVIISNYSLFHPRPNMAIIPCLDVLRDIWTLAL